MNILVTGGTSLIGGAVLDRLLARGDRATSFQRRPTGRVFEVVGDVCDADAVKAAMKGVDVVVHLAAKVGVAGAWSDYERTNVDGTKVVFEAAREADARGFVHVSSPSVAHGGEALVAASAQPADADATRGHYATSKAMAEQWVLARSTTDLPVVAIRPHLVWGPGDTQLVGRIVDRARQGRLALVGAGTALIDSTYLDNAADALVAAVDRTEVLGGTALVVSNGQPRTVAELIGRIAIAAGAPGPRLHVPKKAAFVGGLGIESVWERRGREDDPPMTSFLAEQLSTAHWFDQRRTRELLDWQPAVDLDEGFRRLAASFS